MGGPMTLETKITMVHTYVFTQILRFYVSLNTSTQKMFCVDLRYVYLRQFVKR